MACYSSCLKFTVPQMIGQKCLLCLLFNWSVLCLIGDALGDSFKEYPSGSKVRLISETQMLTSQFLPEVSCCLSDCEAEYDRLFSKVFYWANCMAERDVGCPLKDIKIPLLLTYFVLQPYYKESRIKNRNRNKPRL